MLKNVEATAIYAKTPIEIWPILELFGHKLDILAYITE